MKLVAAATGLALALSACGFGGDDSKQADDATTLDFLAPSYRDGDTGTKALWDTIIADFEKQHPNIDVKLEMQSWDNINDVVRTKLQSEGTTPDILNIDAYANFAEDGLLYPAADVVSDSVRQDFQPRFVENASLNGIQYGLPLFASARTLFYNQDLFDRAGVTTPPRTWDELLDAAKRIGALGGGVSGYGLPLGSEEAQAETSIWTFGAGGSWSDGTAITVDTPQNLDGVQAMKRMIDERATQPNPGASDRTPLINTFIQGQLGMIEGLPPTVAQIAAKNPALKYATAPTPTKTGDPVTLGVADHLMAFRKDGAKQDAIRTFLDYFYSPEVYANFVRTEGFIPITKSGAETLSDDPVTKSFLPTLPNAKFYPANNPKWPAAQGALQQNIGTIDQGADPAAVLQKVQQAVDGA
ncbi:extracellular solute-binding protein [Skermania piniformis]|uniref:Extracellular solute-binding protein n=2 Tax=Skermania pinensis TaxID=39122 RepID=A0ABX8SF53_9ACTN|nr:extracellular solute-binding protein [Skermania piniformis]